MNIGGGVPVTRLASGPQKPDDDARLRKTASQLESLFVQRMFAAMRDTVSKDGLLGQSSAEETFSTMLDEKMAEQVPQQNSGPHSLAEALFHQLRARMQSPAPEAAATASPDKR